MKTLSERNRILNEVKDSCYLAFFDGNPEEGGKEILTGRKKVNFPVATNGYVKSTNQLDFTGGEEDTIVEGNTSQASYTGKNLLKLTDRNYNGIVMTLNEDGSLTMKGTSNTSWGFNYMYYQEALHKPIPAGTYTFSIDKPFTVTPNFTLTLYDENKNAITTFGIAGSNKSVTATTDKTAYYIAGAATGGLAIGTNVDITLKIQLEAGSTATTFEKFVGGIPSPNPEYPQEVVNVKVAGLEFNKISSRTSQSVYQDILYSEDGKWYKHEEVGIADLSTLTWNNGGTGTGAFVHRNSFSLTNIKYVPNNTTVGDGLAEKYVVRQASGLSGAEADRKMAIDTNHIGVNVGKIPSGETIPTPSGKFYYIHTTATDNEITDQATIAALEEAFGSATGVAKYWGIYDSEVGGKLLYYFVMPYEVNIVKDSTITINAGNCVLKEG